jgi:hypothetical protein
MFATFLFANDVEADDTGLCTTFLMYEERPIPQAMLDLRSIVNGRRPTPALRLRVKNADGQTTHETVILD